MAKGKNPYYQVVKGDRFQVRPDQLPPPRNLFTATWCGAFVDSGAIVLSFGQHVGKKVVARVDQRISPGDLREFVTSSQSFLETVLQDSGMAEAQYAFDVDDVPVSRYLVETCTLLKMAWAGEEAEISFYWIAPYDRYLLGQAKLDGIRGPRPLVTISLTFTHLRLLLTQALNLLNEMSDDQVEADKEHS